MESRTDGYVLVVNPKSGGGRGDRFAAAALHQFARHGIRPDVVVCLNGSEPARVAQKAAADGARVVVAIGGDGHAAAVGEGLIGSNATFALVPAGSANDLARSLGMVRNDPRRAVEAIVTGREMRIDTIRVSLDGRERRFLNVVGVGFDAAVAARAERIPVMRGAFRYVLSVMRELPGFSPAGYELRVDGVPREQRAMMIALANGHSYGGGMRVAPSARLDSGRLEICVVGEVSRIGFARAFPRVFRGTHVTHPAVTMLEGRIVDLAADAPVWLIGDGELVGRLPARVSVDPASLAVIVGSGVSQPA